MLCLSKFGLFFIFKIFFWVDVSVWLCVLSLCLSVNISREMCTLAGRWYDKGHNSCRLRCALKTWRVLFLNISMLIQHDFFLFVCLSVHVLLSYQKFNCHKIWDLGPFLPQLETWRSPIFEFFSFYGFSLSILILFMLGTRLMKIWLWAYFWCGPL